MQMKRKTIIGVNGILGILILILCQLASCDNKKETITLNIIPLASTIGNYNILNLSEYAKEIRYIPLETNDSALVGDIRQISYENDKILIKDAFQNCFLFDENGKYCKKIGQSGQGPDDYVSLQQLFIMENLIFQTDRLKILIYDSNGYLVKKSNLQSILSEYHTSQYSIVPLKKDSFVMDVVSAFNHYPKAVLIKTDQSDAIIIREYPNYIELKKSRPGYYGFEIGTMYRFKDEVRIYKAINDTIFTIGKDTEMKAAFIFELGKYKPTISFLERKENISKSDDFITPNMIYESSNHLFIEFLFGNHAPEPFVYRRFVDGSVQSRNTRVYSVFDKLTGELTLMRQPTKGVFGFKNDIDNGPVIWPRYISSDNELVSYIYIS